MKSRLLAGIGAAVLALIGVIMVFNYAQGADRRAVQDLQPVDVMVVQTKIPAGTPAESLAASVVTKPLPASAVADNALTSLDGLTGKVTAVELLPGEPLLPERFVEPDKLQTRGAVDVPKGLQEVSFQLEPQRVLGGRLTPGDFVGVFISMDKGGLENEAAVETTQLVIHKALVTSVQRAPEPTAAAAPQSTASPTNGPTSEPLPTGSLLLTVAVDANEASKIVFAAEYASIWLSKEPLNAVEGKPNVVQRTELYR